MPTKDLRKLLKKEILQNSRKFHFESSQVHDGTSTSAPKITEICSNKHPPTITSEGNALTLSLADVSEQDFAFTFDLKAAYSVFDNGKQCHFLGEDLTATLNFYW